MRWRQWMPSRPWQPMSAARFRSRSKRCTWNCGSHMEGSSSSQGMGQRSRPSSLPKTSLIRSQPSESLSHADTPQPALAALQFAEDFVDRVPAQRIAETGKDDIARQPLVEVREMARHAAPAGHHQFLPRRVAAQEIVGLEKGRDGERLAGLAAFPIHLLVFPKPDIVDFRIGLEQLRQALLEQVARRDGFDIEAGAGALRLHLRRKRA